MTDDTFQQRLLDPKKYSDAEKQFHEPFYFVQAADTQLGMIHALANGGDGEKWETELGFIQQAIRKVNEMKPRPRFLAVCGDLVDALPGSPHKAAQEADFKKAFCELHEDIPLVLLSGNHDIGNTPSASSVSHFRRNFCDDYYSFWVGGIKFLAVNTQYFQDSSATDAERRAHDAWLEAELAESEGARHLVGLQHIPFFLHEPHEPNNYFNLESKLRQHWLQKFKAAGCRYVFCGHYHRNAGGFDDCLEQVITSALGAQLGDDLPGVRVVRVGPDKLTHRYYLVDEIPERPDL